jgi:hypothetical protein
MDTNETLRAIAKSLPGLPQDTVESMLVTFDTLVHFGDQGQRPEAALFLRDAAVLCGDPAQKERLLRAADSVIAGQAVALTPDGLTWQQAAAAQTVSAEDWVEPPEPVYPPEANDEEMEELEESEEDEQRSSSLPACVSMRVDVLGHVIGAVRRHDFLAHSAEKEKQSWPLMNADER